MIFQLIAILIIIYSFINFRKAFLTFVLYDLFLNININFLSIPGVPILAVEDALIMVFAAEFALRYWNKKKGPYTQSRGNFPFRIPFILLVISWTISTVFALVGFASAVSAYVKQILEYVIMTYLMWRVINTKKDLVFLMRGFTVLFLICGIYEVFEIATQSNPLSDYETSLVQDQTRAIDFGNYEDEQDRGFRAKSVFSHPIGSGINFGLYIIMALFFLMKAKVNIKTNRLLVLATCLLSLACIIMTKSRGPYLFILIGIFSFVNLKSQKFYRYAIIMALALMVLLPYFSDQLDIFKSLFSADAQARVGGSDANMRFDQLAVAVGIMSMSPLYGLGFKFLNEMSTAITMGLLGSESIWFQVLPQFGIIGIIAYLFMIYWTLIKLPRKYKSSSIFFIGLAYWGVITLTSVPGMQIYLYYLALILVIKYQMGCFGEVKEDKGFLVKK